MLGMEMARCEMTVGGSWNFRSTKLILLMRCLERRFRYIGRESENERRVTCWGL